MAKKKPLKASIVIPALNEEKVLRECIESWNAQDCAFEFEVIIADGGSKDATRRIARSMGARVVMERTRTIAAGRQKGALAAKGELIAFSDADAVLPPNWLRELLVPFKDGRVTGTLGSFALFDGNHFEDFLCATLVPSYLWFSNVIKCPSGAGSCMACRASAFKESGGFNVKLVTAEDVDLQKKMQKLGRVVFTPKAKARVSARRIRKWGYWKFFSFHARNWFEAHFLGRAESHYERVR